MSQNTRPNKIQRLVQLLDPKLYDYSEEERDTLQLILNAELEKVVKPFYPDFSMVENLCLNDTITEREIVEQYRTILQEG